MKPYTRFIGVFASSLLTAGLASWGARGGYIVTQGAPAQIAEAPGSYTGQYLYSCRGA